MLGMDAARWEEAGEPGGTGTEPADHHSLGSLILEAFPNLNDCGIPNFPMWLSGHMALMLPGMHLGPKMLLDQR